MLCIGTRNQDFCYESLVVDFCGISNLAFSLFGIGLLRLRKPFLLVDKVSVSRFFQARYFMTRPSWVVDLPGFLVFGLFTVQQISVAQLSLEKTFMIWQNAVMVCRHKKRQKDLKFWIFKAKKLCRQKINELHMQMLSHCYFKIITRRKNKKLLRTHYSYPNAYIPLTESRTMLLTYGKS